MGRKSGPRLPTSIPTLSQRQVHPACRAKISSRHHDASDINEEQIHVEHEGGANDKDRPDDDDQSRWDRGPALGGRLY